MSGILKIDEDWSIAYDSARNNAPVKALFKGGHSVTIATPNSGWGGINSAMFHALLEAQNRPNINANWKANAQANAAALNTMYEFVTTYVGDLPQQEEMKDSAIDPAILTMHMCAAISLMLGGHRKDRKIEQGRCDAIVCEEWQKTLREYSTSVECRVAQELTSRVLNRIRGTHSHDEQTQVGT